MTDLQQLDDLVGKNINKICRNTFHDPALNHCAHFASHVLGLDFSFNCKGMAQGGREAAANIRVHEMFAQCPKVGRWEDADLSRDQLIFVTRAGNVNLDRKSMVNIPAKHVGIFHKGKIYHYGNTADQVTTDTPESFRRKFDRTYGPGQGYFFGWIPGENLQLNVQPTAASVRAGRKFVLEREDGKRWMARETGDQASFFVGNELNDARRKFHGLCVPVAKYWGPQFKAKDYVKDLDHWAVLLEVSGWCESQNRMVLVNTYDRAKFTFGFYQLAAHTPADNLILFFRELATLPAFPDYFPELKLMNGRLHRVSKDGGASDLELPIETGPDGETNLQLFMNYLNPNRVPIDEQEVLQAARLIHWTVNDPAARLAQVKVAASILQRKLAVHARKLGLDGRSDTICAIVSDIFHQGRGTYAQLRPLLSGPKPEEALLAFKETQDAYKERTRNLRHAIGKAKEAGLLGKKRYSAAAAEFI